MIVGPVVVSDCELVMHPVCLLWLGFCICLPSPSTPPSPSVSSLPSSLSFKL